MPSLPLETEQITEPLAEARPVAAPTGWHGGRGPAALGRHAIVADASAPASRVERLPQDRGRRCCAATHPRRSSANCARAAAAAESLVIELRVALDDRPREIDQRPQHLLGPGHTFWRDELHQLIWRNAVDLRVPDAPRWSVLDDAAALGARPVGDATVGDVVLPTGEAVWLDGGPIRHHDPIAGIPVLHAVQIEHRQLAAAGRNDTEAALAADQLAAVTHTGGSAPHHRSCRVGQDAGAHRTRQAPDHRAGASRRPL